MSLDFGSDAKRGFLLTIALIAIGVVGSTMSPSVAGKLPEGADGSVRHEPLRAAVGFVSVFGSGIFLPFTD